MSPSSEHRFRTFVRSVAARNPDASMVKIVRAFPMTWWTAWADILLAFALGGVYLLSGTTRFDAHAYDIAKALLVPPTRWAHMMPMTGWAVLFIALAAAQMVTMRTSLVGLRRVTRAGAYFYVFYAALFGIAASQDHRASFAGTVVYLYVAVIHLAAASTLKLIAEGVKSQ